MEWYTMRNLQISCRTFERYSHLPSADGATSLHAPPVDWNNFMIRIFNDFLIFKTADLPRILPGKSTLRSVQHVEIIKYWEIKENSINQRNKWTDKVIKMSIISSRKSLNSSILKSTNSRADSLRKSKVLRFELEETSVKEILKDLQTNPDVKSYQNLIYKLTDSRLEVFLWFPFKKIW